MNLDGLLFPWKGTGFRHIPRGSPFGVLDFRFCGQTGDGRWHYAGQPTLYVAGSQGIAITEFARHFDDDRAGVVPRERTFYELDLALDRVLDLRATQVQGRLALEPATDFLDPARTRAIANLVRTGPDLQGLIVPPIGHLDQPGAWNLVLFLERFSAEAPRFIVAHREAGTFGYRPASRPQP